MSCHICGDCTPTLLGVLGRLKWFRCRRTGMDFSRKVKR